MKALMLGSGFTTAKRSLEPIGVVLDEPEWTTLDINPECNPDILFDLEGIEYGDKLPFPDNAFDELHAYQVLEHFGELGDHKGLFSTFREFWRILKPGGSFYGDTPDIHSKWLFGDPGHRRVVSECTLSFLTRRAYEELGKTTSTDYRSYVAPCWWMLLHSKVEGERYAFVLRKVE